MTTHFNRLSYQAIYIKPYIYIERLFEVATESWPEWDFSPRPYLIYLIAQLVSSNALTN